MKHLLLLFLIGVLLDSKGQSLQELFQKSTEAYKKGDFESFEEYTKKALELHPSQPTLLYNLAAAYALNTKTDSAVHALKRILSWNAQIQYEKDEHFKDLMANPTIKSEIQKVSNDHSRQQIQSAEFLKLGAEYHLEDIVIVGDEVIATDIRNGKLLKYNLKEEQIVELTDLNGAAMAIILSHDGKSVWVSSSPLPQYKGYLESDSSSKVFEVNIKSGAIISDITISESKDVLGSMVLGQNGKLYATSSAEPKIFIVDVVKKKLEEIIPVEEAFNLQGIAMNTDGSQLYIADYIKGIAILDLDNDNKRTWLTSRNYLLKGIDGLTFSKSHELVAIQNNSIPKRLIMVSHDGKEVVDVELIDNSLLYGGEPTNGKISDGYFYYIANSQWPFYTKENEPDLSSWEGQVVRRVKID